MAWAIDGICKIKSVDLSFELVGLLVDELTSWRVDKSGEVVGLIVDELTSWRVYKLLASMNIAGSSNHNYEFWIVNFEL